MEVVRRRVDIEAPPDGFGFTVGEYKLAKVIHRSVKMFVTLAESEYAKGKILAKEHNLTRVVCESAKKLVLDLELGYRLGKS